MVVDYEWMSYKLNLNSMLLFGVHNWVTFCHHCFYKDCYFIQRMECVNTNVSRRHCLIPYIFFYTFERTFNWCWKSVSARSKLGSYQNWSSLIAFYHTNKFGLYSGHLSNTESLNSLMFHWRLQIFCFMAEPKFQTLQFHYFSLNWAAWIYSAYPQFRGYLETWVKLECKMCSSLSLTLSSPGSFPFSFQWLSSPWTCPLLSPVR